MPEEDVIVMAFMKRILHRFGIKWCNKVKEAN